VPALADQLIAGLSAAHQAGVIHRDLTPAIVSSSSEVIRDLQATAAFCVIAGSTSRVYLSLNLARPVSGSTALATMRNVPSLRL
jgi:serine/threonine protein kinase